MQAFWKAALAVGGLAAVGAFVLWSLYKQWLSLPIFSQVSPDQTFALMKIFLYLTFIAFAVCAVAFAISKKKAASPTANSHVFELHKCWEGINEIDCDRLIGPDVTNAARALTITTSSWLKALVDKDTIVRNHFDDYELLLSAMDKCEKIVPGFEKRGTKCKDLISDDMRRAFQEMKQHKERMKYDEK